MTKAPFSFPSISGSKDRKQEHMTALVTTCYKSVITKKHTSKVQLTVENKSELPRKFNGPIFWKCDCIFRGLVPAFNLSHTVRVIVLSTRPNCGVCQIKSAFPEELVRPRAIRGMPSSIKGINIESSRGKFAREVMNDYFFLESLKTQWGMLTGSHMVPHMFGGLIA